MSPGDESALAAALLMDEWGTAVGAYLAMETALAKRILADTKAKNAAAGHPDEWPGNQEWDGLGQTSHEYFWRCAREEAGLPKDAAFKNKLLGDQP